ncbi:MAG: SRPBCC domain-containing protein, partial [Chitinophagaceae bacterium]|nr:SRPBCC domain-containing protein [Chitinophagaceae bacterium]
MKKAIKHNCFYHASPETVWEFLTNPELLASWLMENDIQPITGHKFMFKTKPLPGFDGNVYCKVLDVVLYKKLSYSWRGGPGDGKFTLDSVVTWTLNGKEDGTELFLEHAGFDSEGDQMGFEMMDAGWKKNLEGK